MCFNLNKQNLYRPQQKRSFTPQSITKFNEMLENIDIIAILNETNPNLAFKLLMDDYKSTFNSASLSSSKILKTKINSHGLIMIFIY